MNKKKIYKREFWLTPSYFNETQLSPRRQNSNDPFINY